MQDENILRPINYPHTVAGSGVCIVEVENQKIAIINMMGIFAMYPTPINPFIKIQEIVKNLKKENIQNIIIDIHAEATSEKRMLYAMLKNQVNVIFGTHTHIGTDDLEVYQNRCCYVTDIGMSGSCDGVIGMQSDEPIQRVTQGLSRSLQVIKESDNNLLQLLIIDIDNGTINNAQKLKIYTKLDKPIMTQAIWI